MYKLAVFDMDGTLLNSKGVVSEENIKALDYLKEKGVKTVIATGRPLELLKKYTIELEVDEYVISCNGSVIAHPFNGNVIHENVIDKDVVISIVEMCEENGYGYLLYTKDAVVSKDNERLRLFKRMGKDFPKEHLANIIETEDSNYIKNNYSPNKILITEKDPIKYEELKEKLSEYEGIEFSQSWRGALDVSPVGDNKGNAVKKLSEYFGILQEEIITFGDNLNDLSMIKFAGMGVAMSNGEDELKEVANYITSTNDENGVAKAIYKFIK